MCYIGGGDDNLSLNWSSLQGWLVAAVRPGMLVFLTLSLVIRSANDCAKRSWVDSFFHLWQVQALPPEYLKQGEVEILIRLWISALEAAASDCYKNRVTCNGGRAGAAGYMQGDGGRTLKRVLREFADAHRFTSPVFVP